MRPVVARFHKPLFVLLFVVLTALGVSSTVRSAQTAPARSAVPAPRVRACDRQHPVECRKAVSYWRREAAQAAAAVSWQKTARAHEVRRVLESVRGKQPFTYAARLAFLACKSFSATPARCRPPGEMLGVGRCESGLQVKDPNPSSSADGWTQFLESTWNRAPAGELGWSRYDVLAMGIATEGLVHRDGSWREWSCGWAA